MLITHRKITHGKNTTENITVQIMFVSVIKIPHLPLLLLDAFIKRWGA